MYIVMEKEGWRFKKRISYYNIKLTINNMIKVNKTLFTKGVVARRLESENYISDKFIFFLKGYFKLPTFNNVEKVKDDNFKKLLKNKDLKKLDRDNLKEVRYEKDYSGETITIDNNGDKIKLEFKYYKFILDNDLECEYNKNAIFFMDYIKGIVGGIALKF